MYLCSPGVFHVNIRIASCFPILNIFLAQNFHLLNSDSILCISCCMIRPVSILLYWFDKQIWEMSKFLLRHKINFGLLGRKIIGWCVKLILNFDVMGLSSSKSENWAKFFWDVKLIFPGETSQLIFVLGLVYTQEELGISRIFPKKWHRIFNISIFPAQCHFWNRKYWTHMDILDSYNRVAKSKWLSLQSFYNVRRIVAKSIVWIETKFMINS